MDRRFLIPLFSCVFAGVVLVIALYIAMAVFPPIIMINGHEEATMPIPQVVGSVIVAIAAAVVFYVVLMMRYKRKSRHQS
jgi:hypothetical protein